jgi:tetratricopeptide (TPR) repeat protein
MRRLDLCIASVGRPFVYACVVRLEQQQAARVPPPLPPKDEAASATKNEKSVRNAFVAPPRTIADITAILDSEKPDDAKIGKLKEAADIKPPTNVSSEKLAEFYFNRATARGLLSRNKEALEDAQQGLALRKGTVDYFLTNSLRHNIALQYSALGDQAGALAELETIVRESQIPARRGFQILAMQEVARLLVSMGNVSEASTYSQRVQAMVQEARGSPAPAWRATYAIYGNLWEAQADAARAVILAARGQYSEAEAAYRRAEAFMRGMVRDLNRYDHGPPPEVVLQYADGARLTIAHIEARQGQLSEAEVDARRALLGILKQDGKYCPATPTFIVGLADILVEEGRHQEAEKLARAALEVERTLGVGDDSPESANILSQLGNILVLQGRMTEAANVYAVLDKAIAQWTPQRREVFELNGSRIFALYASGQVEAGIAAAENMVKRQTTRIGEKSFDAAVSRGVLAVGLLLPAATRKRSANSKPPSRSCSRRSGKIRMKTIRL